MAKSQKPLEQQITEAQARAKAAKCDLISIYADGEGNVTWTITSACDANVWYHVTYGADNHLGCDCPATVVCKHIGQVLNRNVDYTCKSKQAHALAAPAAEEIVEQPTEEAIEQATEAAIEAAEEYAEDYDEWAAFAGALDPVDLAQSQGNDEAFGCWLDQETAKLEEEAALAEARETLERLWQPVPYMHDGGEADPEQAARRREHALLVTSTYTGLYKTA